MDELVLIEAGFAFLAAVSGSRKLALEHERRALDLMEGMFSHRAKIDVAITLADSRIATGNRGQAKKPGATSTGAEDMVLRVTQSDASSHHSLILEPLARRHIQVEAAMPEAEAAIDLRVAASRWRCSTVCVAAIAVWRDEESYVPARMT